MKTSTIALIAVGAAGVGVGGYFLIRRRNTAVIGGNSLPPTSIFESEADRQAREAARLRSIIGAKAAGTVSSGVQSAINAAKSAASSTVGGAANILLPGSGGVVKEIGKVAANAAESVAKKAGSVVVSALKSLKFW